MPKIKVFIETCFPKPKNGFNVFYRKLGEGEYIFYGNVANTVTVVEIQVPELAAYEGYIISDCGSGKYGDKVPFEVFPPMPSRVPGTMFVTCMGGSCSGAGVSEFNFTFPNPTPAEIRLTVGYCVNKFGGGSYCTNVGTIGGNPPAGSTNQNFAEALEIIIPSGSTTFKTIGSNWTTFTGIGCIPKCNGSWQYGNLTHIYFKYLSTLKATLQFNPTEYAEGSQFIEIN